MMVSSPPVVVVLLALVASHVAYAAFYVPGVSPQNYMPGDVLDVKVNALTSNQGVMPFPFYSFRTCEPSKAKIKALKKKENIGELLWGDQIEPSEYTLRMNTNVTCQALCDLPYNAKEMKTLEKLIDQQYRGNLILDNLPVAQPTVGGPHVPRVILGYPLGLPRKFASNKSLAEINNHLHFTVHYHEPADITIDAAQPGFRIVGFYVSAHSLDYGSNPTETCAPGKPFDPRGLKPVRTNAKRITWTYSVSFVENVDLSWATRWDVYLKGTEHDSRVHWFAIVNSLVVVVVLSSMVAMILLRLLNRDFAQYNAEDAQEDTGWKLVHQDVARPPPLPAVLSAIVGSGTQLLCMAGITLTFAAAGFLNPSRRGSLLTAVILLFVLLGALGGYVSARLCKLFDAVLWRNAFLTGVLLPGIVFSVYFVLNLVQWYKQASSAIPFTTLLALFGLWLLVSVPLVLVGASIGFRSEKLKMPTHVSPLPRLVPQQMWYMETTFLVAVCGIIPFGAVYIELAYILSSFWQARVYYMFGFLALVFIILIITCAEVTVVMIYFQLTHENYHWWWRSFFLTASSGVHLYLYSLYYLVTALSIRQPTSVMLYLGYMFVMSTLYGTACGTIGFLSSLQFVRSIYSRIKVD